MVSTLGRRIKQLRRSRHWTAADLAAQAETVSVSTIAKLETGHQNNITVYQAADLARALRVSVEYLIDAEIPDEALIIAAEIASARIALRKAFNQPAERKP